MANNLFELDHICAGYGPIQVLHDVSLHVKSSEIVTLIGANGAGKSTLLMSVFAHPPITSGNIRFEQEVIDRYPTHDIAKHRIAMVPEGRRLFPSLTVQENLLLGNICNQDKAQEQDLDTIYDLFPRLKQRYKQRAGTLSGGEQQMLAIGRGLMSRPKLLLLDEPSLGLAPLLVRHIFEVLAELNRSGTTIFLVEQNAYLALKLAHRGYVLVNGRITLSGSGEELLANPMVKHAYLGGESG